jgi:uncharacterized cupin superfamily protein
MEKRRIVNISEVEFMGRPAAMGTSPEGFDSQTGQVAQKIGAKLLGYNITKVPPGKRAVPLHNHRVNEEMFFIIKGTGEIRTGNERFPVREGDFIACPPGGPETAHQIINTGSEEMRYLAVSTKLYPEIAEYPDSGKFGVLAEFEKDAEGKPDLFRYLGKTENSLSYWDGESGLE